ncbi:hypothetical protein B0G75_11313 [Paraburkholderia sp. BL18I3N2]|uniref:HEPN domain-containing protein n=1 Tax=Paraburkholderia sp. BL18I3N2 TaxID=1938799 RepID=UPI000D07717E|nr:HEPN domain-containing protein [Paraburkholderia sp. BL18I3N2]PRX27792.1 hypothetical protein B0G75_11313 [Paraburkholderia sp. BL18I3N2]
MTLKTVLAQAVARNADHSKFRFENSHPLEPAIIQVPDDLLIEACKDPEIARLDQLIFNQGTMAASFGVMFLLRALIAQAIERGVDQAIASMDAFLAAESNRCIDVLLLEGVSVRETTEIVSGIFLCPLSAVPSSTLQTYLRFRGTPQPALPFSMSHLLDEEERKPGAALYSIREAKPKLLDKLPSFSHPADTPTIYQVADILTVAGPSSPVVFKSYSELADGEFMKGHVGFSWGRARNETRVFTSRELSAENLDELRSVADKYSNLSPSVKKKLQVPLHRLNEAVKHQDSVDRALDLGIALESLLLAHQPSKEQLSLQFRLRGAWLLGRNGQHRAELFDTFNKLYSYRSFAAHSGAVAPTKTSAEEVKKTLASGLRLCGQAICKIVEEGGFPEWDGLVVGANYRVGIDDDLSDGEAW